jgi:acyl-CoA thioester hydrolase
VSRYTLEVRYSECDMQQVVHNSVYLRWCDDLADSWFRELDTDFEGGDWDVMVKAASISWTAPARVRDRVDVDIAVSRIGTTSFDVAYTGSRGGEPLFEATMTYVGVRRGTVEKVPVPDAFRAAVGG